MHRIYANLFEKELIEPDNVVSIWYESTREELIKRGWTNEELIDRGWKVLTDD